MLGDEMQDAVLFLHLAADDDEAGAHHHLAVFLQRGRPDDDVGDPGLVLDRHEDDALGGARPLAHQDDASDRGAALVGDPAEIGASGNAPALQHKAEEAHGVRFQRQAQRPVVGNHVLGQGHGGQDGGLLAAVFGGPGRLKQRQRGLARKRPCLPLRLAAVEPQ